MKKNPQRFVYDDKSSLYNECPKSWHKYAVDECAMIKDMTFSLV